MRIAVIERELCKPQKCSLECTKVCPINRSGKKCVYLDHKARIEESLCIDCGLCIKACPFKAISVVNTPEQLKETPVHRYGQNQFVLFRLPFPIKGEVVGLLGPNGLGKTTALKILSGQIKPNLGREDGAELREIIKIFRGTELQSYLQALESGVRTVTKPQQISELTKIKESVGRTIEKFNERGVAKQLVKDLQLEGVLERQFSQLSGGELQRVAICIAASRQADFYFIDEPSSYLDVFQRLQVAKVLRNLARGAAVMVVEHDLATLDLLADRLHILYGVPGVFGVISKPYSTRVGINAFLDGFLRDENMRIRKEPLDFRLARLAPTKRENLIISWPDLSKSFDSFSLEVRAGEIYESEIIGIFGCNGLGKTTFARLLARELEPDRGKLSTKIKISYKPQYLKSDFEGTVSELLIKKELVEQLGLERLLERRVCSLSGGELQRVAIALALCKEADLYLLDEPSAYLDSEQRLELAKLLRKFSERGHAVMVIDHDLLFLSYVADRAMLFSGQPSVRGQARTLELEQGLNEFLKSVDITFRRDPQTGRPRANKPGSQKDLEQKRAGKYFASL